MGGGTGLSALLAGLKGRVGRELGDLAAIERHVGPDVIDAVVVHRGPIDGERLAPYRQEGAAPVEVDRAALAARSVRLVEADLVGPGPLVRHDPERLAELLIGELGRGG